MPKRSSTQHLIRQYKRKIRKLEVNSNYRQLVSPIIYSSDESEESNEETLSAVHDSEAMTHDDQEYRDPPLETDALVGNSDPVVETRNGETITITEPTAGTEPGSVPSATPATETESAPTPSDTPAISIEPELDPDMLLALGESTSDDPDFGDKIHENLAKLWLPLLEKGMLKETKDKLVKEYLIPDNCRLLQAPKLNAEISAAIPDMARNRDKNLLASQQQLGFGITAINRGMDLLLKGQDKIQAMKHLSNGCRILADSHFAATQNRIKLLSPCLNKTFLQVIQDTKRDETLFGLKLSEKIKASKAIEKQGLQIKKFVKTQKPSTSTTAQPSGSRPSYQGNWTAPPPPRYPSSRGGRGGARRPAYTGRRPTTAPQAKSTTSDKTRAPARP